MTPQNAESHLGLLLCLISRISSKNEIKVKNTPDDPKNENGLFHPNDKDGKVHSSQVG